MGGHPGRLEQPSLEPISREGRVKRVPSPTIISAHLAPGEGLEGGEGHPTDTRPQQSISGQGRVPRGEGHACALLSPRAPGTNSPGPPSLSFLAPPRSVRRRHVDRCCA